MKKHRIVVADDSQPFLERLTSFLAAEFDIVATAIDGKTALNLIRHHQPDVAVLDLHMPTLSGIEVARELAKSSPGLPIVICSMETDPDIVEAARKAGANYVFKTKIETDLIAALKSAALGTPSCEALSRPTVPIQNVDRELREA